MTEMTTKKVANAIETFKETKKLLIEVLTEVTRESTEPITVSTYDIYGYELHAYELKMEGDKAVCCTDDDCDFYGLDILEAQELYDILCNIETE